MTPALLLAWGCSDEMAFRGDEAALDTANGPPTADALEPQRVQLRIDVFPSRTRTSDATDATYRALPQSLIVGDLSVEDVDVGTVVLGTPQRQTGTVTAYAVNPSIASLPGEEVPVRGTVRIRDPGSVQSYVATTEADGSFEAWVVPDAYRLEIVPDDPLLPILTRSLAVDEAPTPEIVDLGAGVPVYGFVRRASGAPVVGAKVHVQEPDGAVSAAATSDANGFYQVRVTPGTWSVVSEGRALGQDPVLTLPPIEVGDTGAHVDVDYPTDLDQVLVQGTVVDGGAAAIEDSVVRLVATSLPDYEGLAATWAWSTEVPVASNSTFVGYVVPGVYTIEVLPPTADAGEEDFTPLRLEGVELEADADLGELALARLRSVGGTVREEGRTRGLAGAQVTCSEKGFDGRFWTVFTNQRGEFTVDLPRVPLACEILPPGDAPGLAPRWIDFDPSQGNEFPVNLPPGQAVRGVVETEEGPEEFAVVEVLDLDDRRIGFGFTDGSGAFEIRVDLDQARVTLGTP